MQLYKKKTIKLQITHLHYTYTIHKLYFLKSINHVHVMMQEDIMLTDI